MSFGVLSNGVRLDPVGARMSGTVPGRRKSDRVALAALPLPARTYVVAVIVAGVACLAEAARDLPPAQPGLFFMLLAIAVLTSTAKIELPLGRSKSNLSLSHAVNFWALFSLGPAPKSAHQLRSSRFEGRPLWLVPDLQW